MDVDADGREELLVPAALRNDWCYTQNPRTEPIEYCGDDFLRGNAPAHLDRSIYRWDAIRVRFDNRGRPRLERMATSIEAPLRAMHVEDFRGDGLPDVRYRIAHMYGEGPVGTVVLGRYRPPLPLGNFLARNRGAGGTSDAPDLLQHVRDGLGRAHAFAYAPLSSNGVRGCPASAARPFYRAFRSAAAPHHYHVTTSMRVVARFAAPGDIHQIPRVTCYRYQDAMQSDEGRGFQGFRAIVAEQAIAEDPEDNLRTTTWYHDAFPLTGRVRNIQVTLASDAARTPPLRQTLTEWRARCDGGVCFPYIVEQEQRVRDPASRALLHTTTTRVTYEARDLPHGNPSAIEVVTGDAYRTSTQRTLFHYDYDDVDAWWLNKLVRQTVTHDPVVYEQAPYPDEADNLPKRQELTFTWFDDTDPARRLLARQDVQAGHDTQAQRITYAYDPDGNPVRRTITAARLRASRTTRWRYTADGYFRQQEENPAGHRHALAHDLATGALLSEERYGVSTTYTYDGLGRPLTRHQAGQEPVHVRRLWCDASCPPEAVLRLVTVQDVAPIERRYINARGRVIRGEQIAFGGQGDIVHVAQYDARGRLVRQSQPSQEPNGAYFTEYRDYDALGRPARVIQDRSGHTHGRVTTHYRHAGATTYIERPDGHTAARTHDAHGQLVWAEDVTGHRTHHRYDGQGNLLLIEDAGHRTQAQYDDRGRRIRLVDPDSGRRLFTWDGLHQLVTETDANGSSTHYSYDRIGRLLERRRDRSHVFSWRYDRERPGTLDGEYASSGFSRRYTYDPFSGHLTSKRFPGGETVAFEYDPYGYPTIERNARQRTEVYRRIEQITARGQIARERLGNGLLSTREHMPSTGALMHIQVAADGPGAVQDLA